MEARLQGMRRPYLGASGVCSVDSLSVISAKTWSGEVITHQRVNAKDVFTHRGEFQRCDADFPTVSTTVDFGTQCAAYDLVAKADTQDTDARLRLEDLLCEVDQLEDPGVVVERVVFCEDKCQVFGFL